MLEWCRLSPDSNPREDHTLRRTSRLVLLLGIFLAAATFIVILALNLAPGGTSQPSQAPTSADTVVALVDIPLGTVIDSTMVSKVNLSLDARDKGVLADPSQAIGQKTYTSIKAGAQVHIADVTAPTGIQSLVVPTGKRAFAIQTNELTGVGNLLNIGDKVDVLISLGGGAFPVVQVLPDGSITVVSGLNPLSVKMPLLLEDVQVIGTIDQAAAAAPAQQGAPAASTAPVLTGLNKLLILAVTPAQAEVLLFARTTGTLDVVLRSPDDTATVTTDGVILKTLIDKYGVLPPQLVQAILPKP
jgi:Flp pilus assembly protein CpaB